MMRTHYGHAGQARIHVGAGNRTNAHRLSAILNSNENSVATAFRGAEGIVKSAGFTPDLFNEAARVIPENNSLDDPGAMSGPDDAIDPRWAIGIVAATGPDAGRASAAAFG